MVRKEPRSGDSEGKEEIKEGAKNE